MRGQVLFFHSKKNHGFIAAENGDKHFFLGPDWLGENGVHRNEWCEFDSIPNTNPSGEKFVAVAVQPIECPEEHLLYGRVRSYFYEKKYGFIDYVQNGQSDSAFFHLSDVLLIEGREYEPCEGCKVCFCMGQKTDRSLATQIKILSWPADFVDFEAQFSTAEELPVKEPAPVAVSSSVLVKELRNVPMIELIRRRREGRQK
jgi:cold shock CspA family protein